MLESKGELKGSLGFVQVSGGILQTERVRLDLSSLYGAA